MIYLKDIVKPGIAERFADLRRMGIRTVMITGDNPRTAGVIAAEAGVDDFLAEATPEQKMALIREEQRGGRLVAMTGDGTNDAPALAQADVGVAMNTGTQAAKEAGNMVDLDSDPTKLIDIVEIGKQLLITRGSLTTFSIANDVAKYFAIIPAMFAGFASLSVLNDLNIMDLQTPSLGDPVRGHLQRVDHRGVDPAGVAGREVRPGGRSAAAATQPADLRARWCHRSVHRHQVDRHHRHCAGGQVMRRQLLPSLISMVIFTVILGIGFPLVVLGIGQLAFKDKADGSIIERNGKAVGSSLIGQAFTTKKGDPLPQYFQSRPSAAVGVSGKTVAGYDPTLSSGSNLGPTNPDFLKEVAQRVKDYRKLNRLSPNTKVPVDAVTASGSGLDPHISIANARLQAPARCRRTGDLRRQGQPARRRPHHEPGVRHPRREGGERARAQPRARSAHRRNLVRVNP